MVDVHEPAVRSYNMSQIKGKNTKPELIVRKFLHANGFRFRIHERRLPGKPDIVLPKYKTVVLVHGCFWHCHDNCKYSVIPKTRTEWWKEKLLDNKVRDEKYIYQLEKLGWKVKIIWECELRSGMMSQTLDNILDSLKLYSKTSR